jgi:hypothetical protein
MEYVSVLAGEPFTDRPRCVDPLLRRLSWSVNDRSTPDIRRSLVELAPELIHTATHDPTFAPRVVAACTAFAARLGGREVKVGRLVSAQRRAESRLRRLRAGDGNRGDRYYRLVHAQAALEEAARVTVEKDRGALPHLLRVAVVAAKSGIRETVPSGSLVTSKL